MTTARARTDRRPTTAMRRLSLVAATLLAGVVVAGCGDDDAGDMATPEPEATTDTEATDGETEAADAGPVTIEIVSITEAYDPSSATVSAGSEVTWSNTDDVVHTATAEDGTFDSGDIEPGGEFTFTPEEPGTYAYVCTIHPNMSGELIVE